MHQVGEAAGVAVLQCLLHLAANPNDRLQVLDHHGVALLGTGLLVLQQRLSVT